MSGLRERKKYERRSRMVGAARRLFSRDGYNAVTMEKIAQDSDVSPGTVYNTFETKYAILFEIFLTDIQVPISMCNDIIRSSAQPKLKIRRILDAYFDWLSTYPKALVRSFVSLAFARPEEAGRDQAEIDELVFNGIGGVFDQAFKSGNLPSKRVAEMGASVVFALAQAEFHRWLVNDEYSAKQATQNIMAQVSHVWSGLFPDV